MPTVFAHAAASAALAQVGRPRRPRMPVRFWVLTAICGMVPDIDVAGFIFNIQYRDWFGHRGATHSICFACCFGLVAAAWYRWSDAEAPAGSPRIPWGLTRLTIYFSLITLSHSLLDALTDGGLGVALFSPFSNVRYFFPWRPIAVSPIGSDFFHPRGLQVLANELWWIFLPAAAVSLFAWFWRKRLTDPG